ncbi:MAG: biopolymer transporter ExbD [Bacillota bacterium]|jgi:biopolymer transport protein ExbD
MEFKIKRRSRKIEIVPMIDIMFFMLVFFMLFATFEKAKTGIEVDVPKTVNIGESNQNTMVISIDRNDRVFWGKEPVSLEQLQLYVREKLRKDAAARFVIKPDAQVRYEKLIAVTDSLASEGVFKPLWGVDRQQMPNVTDEAGPAD